MDPPERFVPAEEPERPSQTGQFFPEEIYHVRWLGDSMKAVIPAAGLGTRFLPYTKAMPKEMIPIVDKPAIQFVVEEAVASGMREILIVTGRKIGRASCRERVEIWGGA